MNSKKAANSHNKDAATPLMYASMLGHLKLVELLLEQGTVALELQHLKFPVSVKLL